MFCTFSTMLSSNLFFFQISKVPTNERHSSKWLQSNIQVSAHRRPKGNRVVSPSVGRFPMIFEGTSWAAPRRSVHHFFLGGGRIDYPTKKTSTNRWSPVCHEWFFYAVQDTLDIWRMDTLNCCGSKKLPRTSSFMKQMRRLPGSFPKNSSPSR